jgi:DNA-binding transcriptional LysR family regulator
VREFLRDGPPTRLRLREETLSGTLFALTSGQADLAIGVAEATNNSDIHTRPLGDVSFVYAVAPHHPLATAVEPDCPTRCCASTGRLPRQTRSRVAMA